MNKYLLMSTAAAALIVANLPSGATAATPSRASAVTGFHGVKAPVRGQSLDEPRGAPKCGTGFGAELPTPDGLIAWNGLGNGFDTGGGADFTCSAKTKIKKVFVLGYNAPANPEQYNVTFYKNDTAGGTDEGNDAQVVCSYTALSGAGGGSYPTHVLTKLSLPTPCKVKPGKYWVEVQNNDSAGPWYWEMTSQLSGTQADWVDRQNAFGTGCTTLDNNAYLSNCLGYTYPDYMLELH
jgi:hypothetical protein